MRNRFAVSRDSFALPLPQDDSIQAFHHWFSAEIASTEDHRQDVYRLRYQVYCAERGYDVDTGRLTAGLEADCFDDRSLHALVRHKESGLAIGTVRLVLRNGVGESSFLPIEEYSAHVFEPSLLKPFDHTSQKVGEVSRFAVSKEAIAKVLSMESPSAFGSPTGSQYQQSGAAPTKMISWGLIALLFKMSEDVGINQWMALMERPLARHLSRIGIDFHGIGPFIDHYGKRQPMIANVNDLLDEIKIRHNEFFSLVQSITSNKQVRYLLAPKVFPLLQRTLRGVSAQFQNS